MILLRFTLFPFASLPLLRHRKPQMDEHGTKVSEEPTISVLVCNAGDHRNIEEGKPHGPCCWLQYQRLPE